jgi:hypothetical protein
MRWILALNGRGWGGFKDLTAKKKEWDADECRWARIKDLFTACTDDKNLHNLWLHLHFRINPRFPRSSASHSLKSW